MCVDWFCVCSRVAVLCCVCVCVLCVCLVVVFCLMFALSCCVEFWCPVDLWIICLSGSLIDSVCLCDCLNACRFAIVFVYGCVCACSC